MSCITTAFSCNYAQNDLTKGLKKNERLSLPCITFKPAVGCDHVYARWFEGKFPWENQFAMIVTTYEKQDKSK